MKKLVVLTGAGISQESGIKTFRDPQMVLDFYNMRRKQLYEVEPNDAHYALAKLEETYEVNLRP